MPVISSVSSQLAILAGDQRAFLRTDASNARAIALDAAVGFRTHGMLIVTVIRRMTQD